MLVPPESSQTGSQTGFAMGIPADESHVRTNERTERVGTCVNQETAVDASARSQEFTTIGDVIAAGELWQSDRRHEVTRSGEREPIASHVRSAVWYRDRGECAHCRYEKMPEHVAGILNLDHIQPWSAGGSDETSNLRLLCEYHNKRRSNFVDFDRPKMSATWWCLRCYAVDMPAWFYLPGSGFVQCPTHTRYVNGTSQCRVVRRYRQQHDRAEGTNWHERDALEGGELTAYCAHCNAPGLTAVVL